MYDKLCKLSYSVHAVNNAPNVTVSFYCPDLFGRALLGINVLRMTHGWPQWSPWPGQWDPYFLYYFLNIFIVIYSVHAVKDFSVNETMSGQSNNVSFIDISRICKLRSTGQLSARTRSNREHFGETSKTMDINPSLQICGWNVNGTGCG